MNVKIELIKRVWVSQGKEFDSILFRSGPPDPATPHGKPVSLHPMIEKTEGVFASLNEAKIIDFETFPSKNWYPKDYPTVLDEFATHPASAYVGIFMPDAYEPQLNPLFFKATGITVRHFLEHLGRFWSTPAPTRAARYAMKLYGIRNAKGVKYMHILAGDHVWTSWMGGVAHGENRTKVTAGGFVLRPR